MEWLPTHIKHCVIEDVVAHPQTVKQTGHVYVPPAAIMTQRIVGRFQERWKLARGEEMALVKRSAVRKHLHANKRNGQTPDTQVIEQLTFRFGGKGTKKNPGPLYGIKSHAWQALGVAVTYAETVPVADF